MRKLLVVTAAVLAAVIAFVLAVLPPNPIRLSLEGADPDLVRRTIRGAYHIHTSRSDGADVKPAIAAAAARAGLQFAIFADHGDGTRPADPPAYIEGVLCLDAVEISTNGGHYVAIGLPAAPYPLAGQAAAVVEDVRRLGGFGIAAHPSHPRPQLAWTDWTAPIDGIEWLNADSEWRTETRLSLARTVLSYLLRPAPAIATVFDRPVEAIERWDALSAERRVVAFAAVDAHGSGSPISLEEAGRRVAIGPSYEASFRTVTNRIVLDQPFTGDVPSDAQRLLDAIRRGHVYSVIDAISSDVVVDLAQLRVVSSLPAGAEVVTVEGKSGRRLEVRVPEAPGAPPVPWVLTNWIYSRQPERGPMAATLAVASSAPLPARDWRIEKDESSNAQLKADDRSLTLTYALADGARRNQFVAAASDFSEPAVFGALVFRARASRPMRVSVQLRFRPDDDRWVKSIYLDTEEREIVVPVDAMAPAEPSGGPMPPVEAARSLLFVVDLVNARPGDDGEISISDIRTTER